MSNSEIASLQKELDTLTAKRKQADLEVEAARIALDKAFAYRKDVTDHYMEIRDTLFALEAAESK